MLNYYAIVPIDIYRYITDLYKYTRFTCPNRDKFNTFDSLAYSFLTKLYYKKAAGKRAEFAYGIVSYQTIFYRERYCEISLSV